MAHKLSGEQRPQHESLRLTYSLQLSLGKEVILKEREAATGLKATFY